MGILGVGVDLLHSPRITQLLNRRGPTRFASRVLSLEEISQWKALPTSDQARFLAVRWAVKEAAYKALNPVVIPTWKELTYQGFGEVSGFRKPELVYNPIVPEDSKKIGRMHVSVSHDGEYVIASVLVENPGEVSS